jgi:hypothetical protein
MPPKALASSSRMKAKMSLFTIVPFLATDTDSEEGQRVESLSFKAKGLSSGCHSNELSDTEQRGAQLCFLLQVVGSLSAGDLPFGCFSF